MNTQIEESARKYALQTTQTRCAYMGTDTCKACKKSDRGYCDFRSRYESFIQGAKLKCNI